MKLLKVKTTESYKEIEVQYKFLWWNYNIIYRMILGDKNYTPILKFKYPNSYSDVGILECLSIRPLFLLPNTEEYSNETLTNKI